MKPPVFLLLASLTSTNVLAKGQHGTVDWTSSGGKFLLVIFVLVGIGALVESPKAVIAGIFLVGLPVVAFYGTVVLMQGSFLAIVVGAALAAIVFKGCSKFLESHLK